ncbi:helix-turn-helix domain-containing protein [Alkalihalobacterium elongatum]|uniref:helix-turn-helix domain-containing protein n=1 Tax=Alkalihalobacterium elongatum TaxID=2675466 RepID=UPI001C200AF8|nr:helix-turn-helix transcriptional regulator [Alkalihalobacterium elongatum]
MGEQEKIAEKLEQYVNIIIGKKIRAKRKQLKLSSAEVAFRANITRAYFGRIERAEVTASHFIILKITQVLDLNLNELYEDVTDEVNDYLKNFLPDNDN